MDERKNIKGTGNKDGKNAIANGVSKQDDMTINCWPYISPLFSCRKRKEKEKKKREDK